MSIQYATVKDWLSHLKPEFLSRMHLGLDRVLGIAQQFQLCHWSCPVVIVTGTNGKGSVVKVLECTALALNLNVATYTSPDLLDFKERLTINGRMLEDAMWLKALDIIAQKGVDLSFFEWITLAALWMCRQHPLDLLLLEVGLGGRLDAVNVVDADLSIITTIALDHVQQLGPDRASIAREKAGIFRFGQRAVCGDRDPPEILVHLAQQNAIDLDCLGIDFDFHEHADGTWEWHGLHHSLDPLINMNKKECAAIPEAISYLHLPSAHLPLQNIATALRASHILFGTLTENVVHQIIENAQLMGRYEHLFHQGVSIVLDVAHNPHGATYIAKKIEHASVLGKRYAVIGVLADKDVSGICAPFQYIIDRWYPGTLNHPRAVDVSCIQDALKKQNSVYDPIPHTIEEAFCAALNHATSKDLIIVFGSFHTVSAVKKYLNQSTC